MSSASSDTSSTKTYFVYVGTYGKGIYAYRFDSAGAKLDSIGIAGEIVNPSFLATDRGFRYLYAVSELEGKVNGGVGAFSIDRKTGLLQMLNSTSSGGEAPCHLTVDHTGRMLIVANYGTGGVSSFPIGRDGRLGAMSSLMTAQGSSVNPQRQKGPHAHEAVISSDNRMAYVPDLGLDQIRIYRLEPSEGKLASSEPRFAKVDPGFGPRHIAFAPSGKFAYVANELKSEVTVFSHDLASGALRQVQNASTVPTGFTGENAPAEVRVDRAGRFLYVSNRGPGTITVFAIDPGNGTVRQVQVAETGGTWPRGFEIDPSGRWLFVGDQKSNRFAIMSIDPQTGFLTSTGKSFEVSSPVSFAFVPAS